jgi:hypothetical protein
MRFSKEGSGFDRFQSSARIAAAQKGHHPEVTSSREKSFLFAVGARECFWGFPAPTPNLGLKGTRILRRIRLCLSSASGEASLLLAFARILLWKCSKLALTLEPSCSWLCKCAYKGSCSDKPFASQTGTEN